MKTRIKTKQEFIAEGKNWNGRYPKNWGSNQMDYLYGLPANPSSGYQRLYPDLTDGDPKWNIHQCHLTTEPHPYTLGDFKVRVENQEEWDMVDARCKAMGFNWTDSQRCEYDGQPGIFIRKGGLSTISANSHGRKYFNTPWPEALELTLKQFREGFAPDKEKPEKLDAYIRNSTLRVHRGSPGCSIMPIDSAYKFNLMSEEDFKAKHTPELKLGDFKVKARDGMVHVGCHKYHKDHIKIVRDILIDARENNIGPKEILRFIEKHEDALGL